MDSHHYDSLLEKAYNFEKDTFTQDDIAKLGEMIRADDVYILKCHGDIAHPETIILTADDYERVIHESPAFSKHIEFLFMSKTVLFLGYSLKDPDLELIRGELKSIFKKNIPFQYALMCDVDNPTIEREKKRNKVHILSYEWDETHSNVKHFLQELLDANKALKTDKQTVFLKEDEVPYIGLRSFTEQDAKLYFGREYEIIRLHTLVNNKSLVVVIGASGSGKSSLVGAGLIPAMRKKDKNLTVLRFTPRDNPFDELARVMLAKKLTDHADSLLNLYDPEASEATSALTEYLQSKLSNQDSTNLLLFVDQFEEIFTTTSNEKVRADFINWLRSLSGQIRVVVTMRADFYHLATRYMEEELNSAQLTLAQPSLRALARMIEEPAKLADVTFDEPNDKYRLSLVDRILKDTGDEPGNLALMAYLLEELYEFDADKHFTHEEYDQLGGVQGVIGTRAEASYDALELENKDDLLSLVFRQLVTVDERGTATRVRARQDKFTDAQKQFVDAFTDARLLRASLSQDEEQAPIVEVAHEALFRSWQRLTNWINSIQVHLRHIQEIERSAKTWQANNYSDDFRARGEQLKQYTQAVEILLLDLSAEAIFYLYDSDEEEFRAYLANEQLRNIPADAFLACIRDDKTPANLRFLSGIALSILGDTRKGIGVKEGLPDIDWIPIPDDGEWIYQEDKHPGLGGYDISKYPITYLQFQSFVDAGDGLNSTEYNWFEELAADGDDKQLKDQEFKYSNHPRDNVNWYQAMAFCRWWSWKLRPDNFKMMKAETWTVRLPTEFEWEKAARGTDGREYPYGNKFDASKGNKSTTGIGKTSAVGIFPEGASPCGLLDMSGNVWEWCLTEYDNSAKYPSSENISSKSTRVLRGGSFAHLFNLARAAARFQDDPNFRLNSFGFRVVRPPSL